MSQSDTWREVDLGEVRTLVRGKGQGGLGWRIWMVIWWGKSAGMFVEHEVLVLRMHTSKFSFGVE